jgi:hypothetical protein
VRASPRPADRAALQPLQPSGLPGLPARGLGGLLFGTVATAAMVYAPQDRRTLVQVGTVAALLAVAVAVVVVRYIQFGAVLG